MSDVTDDLKKATQNLLFQSESDEPIEVCEWKVAGGELTNEAIRELSGSGKSVPVKEVALHEFFAPLVEEQDWHGDEEKETVRRYKSLLMLSSSVSRTLRSTRSVKLKWIFTS